MRITILLAALLLFAAGVALAYLGETGGASATYAAAVVCLIFVFLPQFKKFKGFGVEAELKEYRAEFDREIDKLESEAKRLPPPVKPKPKIKRLPPPPGYRSRFLRLAEISPRGAIIEAWGEVENAVQRVALEHEIKEKVGTASSPVIAETFARQGLIDKATYIVFEDLRHLRNKAAHGTEFEPTIEQAKEFVKLAIGIAERL
jgi:sugar-specific transcriptional regulator TrmB